jgi:hypothetical protein
MNKSCSRAPISFPVETKQKMKIKLGFAIAWALTYLLLFPSLVVTWQDMPPCLFQGSGRTVKWRISLLNDKLVFAAHVFALTRAWQDGTRV